MRKLRIYLDTSVISFLFADDAPEKRDATVEFFNRHIAGSDYEVYVSGVVLAEIGRTNDMGLRERLAGSIEQNGVLMADLGEISSDVEELAQQYVAAGVIPQKKMEDALHLAIATVLEMDYLLSWNYKHLANAHKEIQVQSVNLRCGYTRTPRLATPLEVTYEED